MIRKYLVTFRRRGLNFGLVLMILITMAAALCIFARGPAAASTDNGIISTLRTSKIELVDNDGKTVAVLRSGYGSKKEDPSCGVLELLSGGGKRIVSIEASPMPTGGGVIKVFDKDGHNVCEISSSDQGVGIVTVANRKGTDRTFTIDPDLTPTDQLKAAEKAAQKAAEDQFRKNP